MHRSISRILIMELIRFPGHLTEQVGSWSPEHGETEEAVQRRVQA